MNEEMIEAIESVAFGLRCLGTNDAASSMGAIELLAMEVRDGTKRIAEALVLIAEAIR